MIIPNLMLISLKTNEDRYRDVSINLLEFDAFGRLGLTKRASAIHDKKSQCRCDVREKKKNKLVLELITGNGCVLPTNAGLLCCHIAPASSKLSLRRYEFSLRICTHVNKFSCPYLSLEV